MPRNGKKRGKMSDENQNVGEGAEGTPTPPVSKPIDDATIKMLSEIGARIDNLEKGVGGLRAVQGDIDRAQTDFKRTMAEYDKLVKKGMSHDEAVSELENKQKETNVLAELQKQISDLAKRVEGQGRPDAASQKVVEAFGQFDLDLKDPRVLVEMQKPYDSADAMELAAFKLSKSMKQTPQPTPSQNPAPTGGDGKRETASEKIARLTELQKEPSRNRTEINKLVKELDASNWGGV